MIKTNISSEFSHLQDIPQYIEQTTNSARTTTLSFKDNLVLHVCDLRLFIDH